MGLPTPTGCGRQLAQTPVTGEQNECHPPGLRHRSQAKTPVVMLLLLVKEPHP